MKSKLSWRLPPSPSLKNLRGQIDPQSRVKMQFPLLANVPIPEGQGCNISQLGRMEIDDEPRLRHHVDKAVDYQLLEKWPVEKRTKPYPRDYETEKLMEGFRLYNIEHYPWTQTWHFGALPFSTEKLRNDIKRAILDGWFNNCYAPGRVPEDDPAFPGLGLFRKKDSAPSTED